MLHFQLWLLGYLVTINLKLHNPALDRKNHK